MSRPQIIRFLMVIVSLCLSLSALAGTIELEAVGQVTVSGFASVPVGTTLTAFLFYNPAAVPLDTGANYADYVSAQAYWMYLITLARTLGSSLLVMTQCSGSIELEAVGQVTVSGFASVPVGT